MRKMRKRIFRRITVLATLAAVLPFAVAAQDCVLPMRLPFDPTLSANFGELRALNMHSGIDIKTGGREGFEVLAAKDGFIYRVSVASGGYGRAVYMAHSDGTVTIYGHLSRFSEELERHVRTEQYRRRRSNVDLRFVQGMFPYKQGECIGYSGNSGRSYGPHLHFEVVDAVSRRKLDPLKSAGFGIRDDIAPEIARLYYYAVDTVSGVPVHRRIAELKPEKGKDGTYGIPGGLFECGNKGYFALEAVDKKNGASNTLAPHRIEMTVDGRSRFEYIMENFTPLHAGYTHAVAVYDLNSRSRNYVVRLAVMPRDPLPFYGIVADRGAIDPEKDKNVAIEVADDAGNSSRLTLRIAYDASKHKSPQEIPAGAVKAPYKEEFSYSADGLSVTIPAGALFEPIFYWQKRVERKLNLPKGRTLFSPIYSIGDPAVPLHFPVEVRIEADVPEELRGKAMLARVTDTGALAAAGGRWADGAVEGRASVFGAYCVTVDDTPPTLSAAFTKGADMTGAASLVFNVRDDFSGIARFEAYIDGRWAILEYDSIRGRLIHRFDDDWFGTGMTHTIKVRVADAVGNTRQTTTTYRR